MEVPLGESQLKTALQIYNRIKVDDNDFGWFGNATWEFNKYSQNDYFTLQIKFENWRLYRNEIEAFTDYIESLDPVVDVDFYLSDDSPIIFNVKIPVEEVEGDNQ